MVTIVNVAQFIEALSKLPPNAIIKETTLWGEDPLQSKAHGLFFVYERDGVIELHIDDGRAFHADIDEFRTELEF